MVAPVNDIQWTLLYGDDSTALTISGKVKNLKVRHWQEFAASIGLLERAATATNKTALSVARAVDLNALPFTGSPLNGAVRELRFRRSELGTSWNPVAGHGSTRHAELRAVRHWL